MTVELVAVKTSDRVLLEKLPTMLTGGSPNDVDLQEAEEGRCHCLLSMAYDQLVVWDLGTKGGTFVNGSRVNRASLKAGDTLTLGGAEFRVQYQETTPRRYVYGVRC